MPYLNPGSSSPSKRQTSPPSDLVPPYPTNKSRPNSPEKHDSGISGRKHLGETSRSSLNPGSSSPSKRQTSPPSDLVPPYPTNKSRPNSPEKHDSGISGPKHDLGETGRSSLNPGSSSPSKRQTSPPSDLVPPYPTNKSRPNSPEKHDSGISGPKHRSGITEDYLDNLFESRPKRFWEDVAQLPEPQVRADDPTLYCPETLPRGYTWGSYMGGSDIKNFAYRTFCANCGRSGDHMTDNCQYKDSEEAKEFRKRMADNNGRPVLF